VSDSAQTGDLPPVQGNYSGWNYLTRALDSFDYRCLYAHSVHPEDFSGYPRTLRATRKLAVAVQGWMNGCEITEIHGG
jgi:hypothetical protein